MVGYVTVICKHLWLISLQPFFFPPTEAMSPLCCTRIGKMDLKLCYDHGCVWERNQLNWNIITLLLCPWRCHNDRVTLKSNLIGWLWSIYIVCYIQIWSELDVEQVMKLHQWPIIHGVPKKAERSIFITRIFENSSIFWFHQIKHCLLKRMIPRSLKLVE